MKSLNKYFSVLSLLSLCIAVQAAPESKKFSWVERNISDRAAYKKHVAEQENVEVQLAYDRLVKVGIFQDGDITKHVAIESITEVYGQDLELAVKKFQTDLALFGIEIHLGIWADCSKKAILTHCYAMLKQACKKQSKNNVGGLLMVNVDMDKNSQSLQMVKRSVQESTQESVSKLVVAEN